MTRDEESSIWLDYLYRQVAANLLIDPAIVCRTVSLFNETGNVNKRTYPSNVGTRVLTDIDKVIIIETIIERPDIYLEEIRMLLIEAIWRFLQSMHFTSKKMTIIAKQRSDVL